MMAITTAVQSRQTSRGFADAFFMVRSFFVILQFLSPCASAGHVSVPLPQSDIGDCNLSNDKPSSLPRALFAVGSSCRRINWG